jgi:N-acetylglucosamine-6-phosphate deacetylase
MIFSNAIVFRPDFTFRKGGFAIENGRFADIDDCFADGGLNGSVDLGGRFVVPGLVDIHTHGNSGADFSDGDYGGLVRMARYLLDHGVTSFAPASLTLPEKQLMAAVTTGVRLRRERPDGAARIRGINMEGPFFNSAKKGAQNADFIRLPDFGFFSRLAAAADGLVKIVCVAPELEGAIDFIQKASRVCNVSVAHTAATYEQAKAGFDAGARHVTHLFNAMPPLGHRDPGVVGAAAENAAVRVELISDGVHIHPSVVRMVFTLFGADRVILISDAVAACGMPDGRYTLGGLNIIVSGQKATLEDGTIAGSTTNLCRCVQAAISFGVRPEDAIRAATYNPARAIGADHEIGSIESGKIADFVIFNPDWTLGGFCQEGQKVQKPDILR